MQCMRSNTDEFGGYSKPKWPKSYSNEAPLLDTRDDENLCKLVGIDIEKKLQELLKEILPQRNNLIYQKFEKSNITFKYPDLK